MDIILTLPYPDAAKYATIWASEEEQIDFRGEPDRADRCTLSFAACELQKYLKRSGHKVSIATDASLVITRRASSICLRAVIMEASAGRFPAAIAFAMESTT